MNDKYAEKHAIASALVADLAEHQIALELMDMMVEGAREKARAIRLLAESNGNHKSHAVRDYMAARRVIYSAIWGLLDGCGGYKLVKQAS